MTETGLELAELARSLRERLEAGDGAALFPGASRIPPGEAEEREKVLDAANPADGLKALAAEIEACRKCPLGSQRLRAVPGVGSSNARVMFVGEGPGFQEDHIGEPFVGKAGQLLDRILQSIGLSRQTVFIANVVKCHPMVNPSDPEMRGNDRPPTPEEMAACRSYLDEQMRLISPRVIVTLGSIATKALLGEDIGITKVRGLWREYRAKGSMASRADSIVKLLPTYHPAALLRNPELKRDVWTDMKNLKKELETSP